MYNSKSFGKCMHCFNHSSGQNIEHFHLPGMVSEAVFQSTSPQTLPPNTGPDPGNY